MRRTLTALACLAALPAFAQMPSAWSEPVAPHVIYGNTYQVGTKGLSAILVTSPQGHILIDGTIVKNAPLIEANIRKLGFRLEDVKLILNTHAHHDHAGAIAQLAKDTGATVRATAASANMMRLGGKDPEDPQYSPGEDGYPKVDAKGDIVDGSVVTLGPLKLTAHVTPGHTHGGTAWTWDACEGKTCKHIAFVDSLYAFTSDGYRYSDHPAFVAEFRKTFDRVASLPCDILVTPHPEQGEGKTCKSYAEAGRKRLDTELAQEKR
ncbi:subclass B3 metallo-beta-lactamase [Luteibacter sp. CQ10]|uniref:subclass B3 metallo-beta-lactamase n=1 Tax=Luteibacter sp. CQ10 TaxID=2805821 RepID=UPI0034A2D1F7